MVMLSKIGWDGYNYVSIFKKSNEFGFKIP